MGTPKIIHLCWFGDRPLSEINRRCLRSVYRLEQEGYEIKFWTEENYCLEKSVALKKAYKDNRWSLVSNYVRLDVLAKYGGIYLDTDVEIVNNFDPLIKSDFFIGFMWDCTLGTAVIGSAPAHKIICDILCQYETEPEALKSPNNDTFTEYFLKHVNGFNLNGKYQKISNIEILNKYAFEHPSFTRKMNYTVHHFEQSWKNNSNLKELTKKYIIKLFSLWLYRRYVCWNSLRLSQFYPEYLYQKFGNQLAQDNEIGHLELPRQSA